MGRHDPTDREVLKRDAPLKRADRRSRSVQMFLTPVSICVLDSTAGIESVEWAAGAQAEERVWHIFCDKEKTVGSLLIRLLQI